MYEPADLEDGMLRAHGGEASVLTNLRSSMIGYAYGGTMPGGATRIDSVVNEGDVFTSPNWYRLFRLTGNFPSGGAWMPYAWCGGASVSPTITSQSTTQIEFKVLKSHFSSTKYCIFWVERLPDIAAVFGPMRVCPQYPEGDPYLECPQ